MPRKALVRAYVATSLDGFIAGVNDDLTWLPGSGAEDEGADTAELVDDPDAVGFEEVLSQTGAMLMGRGTYDVISGFDVPWPYGDRPVLVATHRTLDSGVRTVRAVSGDIEQLIELARTAANGKDVYVDGGTLIRQAVDAELVDELIVSLVPVLLGEGHSLFAGLTKRHQVEIVGMRRYQGMTQLQFQPVRTSG